MHHFLLIFSIFTINTFSIYVLLKRKTYLFSTSLPKIGIAIISYFVFLVLFCKFSITFFVLLAFLPLILVYLAQFFLFFRKKRAFEQNFIRFLNFLILKMKTGNSFRDSVSKVSCSFDSNFNFTLQKIMQHVTFTQQTPLKISNKLIKTIIKEFILADQAEHLTISRLENFYSSLKNLSDFRRRSGQVTQQIHIQLILICVLYIAVFISSIKWFSFADLENLFLLSMFLFFIGVYVIFRIKRSFKWKT